MPKENKRKAQYVIGLDYPPEKQSRLKKFVGLMGFKSVRTFIVKAIDNEIEAGLEQMTTEKRAAVEEIINN